jgi:hypothetical protein
MAEPGYASRTNNEKVGSHLGDRSEKVAKRRTVRDHLVNPPARGGQDFRAAREILSRRRTPAFIDSCYLGGHCRSGRSGRQSLRRRVHDIDGGEERCLRATRRVETRHKFQRAFRVRRAVKADEDVADLANWSSDNEYCA